MDNCEPKLGCATTEELIDELIARWEEVLPGAANLVKEIKNLLDRKELYYRTIDQH